MSPLLQVNDVVVTYGAVEAVRSMSLALDTGEVVSVIGANGAGKSSLLKAIGGALPPQSGTVVLDGEDVSAMTVVDRVRRGVALVAEGRKVWRDLTVEDHLRLGWFVHRKGHPELTYEGQLDRACELFPRLAERHRQLVGTLSGGEQQMVVIARALMAQPRILLLDEPTLGLAPVVIDDIAEALRRLTDHGLSVLIAEQDARFALDIADRAYVMEVGECRITGASAALKADPGLVGAYLGMDP